MTLDLRPPAAAVARAALRRLVIAGGLEVSALASRTGLAPQTAGLGLVFMLHHVRRHRPQSFDPNALLSITPSFLDAALARLKALGLRPVDLAEIPAAVTNNDPGDPVFAVTLDDGYRNNLEEALPVFEKHGVPFTVFVTSGFVERRFTLWWETAERLLRAAPEVSIDFGDGAQRFRTATHAQKSALFDALFPVMTGPSQLAAIEGLNAAARGAGIDPLVITDQLIMTEAELRRLSAHPLARLEPHTVSHVALAQVGAKQLRDEIAESCGRLREWTGREPCAFAYPYGFLSTAGAREFDATRDAGLALAVTTRPAMLGPRHAATPHNLPRVALNGHFQKPRFVDALASGLPFRVSGLIRKGG
ncbi:polysaccharide deacetylase family protein [Limibaculum sp. M0105]|uniref:Chitooligosaccharide deacetylase n=1 Tax=Thermohalobaculum xanthum TaxID=2753746 RepID=A0A8J7M5C6_9RHOB|nr:polysaccharide deacetylase family protein [Thermohalobaculum xanthum]MBK0398734.1 polysaccharide deacetylase family protein [Thermohalobaculum xanthum]